MRCARLPLVETSGTVLHVHLDTGRRFEQQRIFGAPLCSCIDKICSAQAILARRPSSPFSTYAPRKITQTKNLVECQREESHTHIYCSNAKPLQSIRRSPYSLSLMTTRTLHYVSYVQLLTCLHTWTATFQTNVSTIVYQIGTK